MSKITKDWIDIYFENGVDRANRRIFMFDDIDNKTIGTVIKGLYYMDAELETNKPIELFIGSFGGSEYDMFALHDVTRTINSPIHTTAIGACMSAAPLLVACGEPGHRYATPSTYFMIHQSWWESGPQRLEAHKAEHDHYADMDRRWTALMAKYTSRDEKFWRSISRKNADHYFNAQTALQYGIVDHIWSEKDDE